MEYRAKATMILALIFFFLLTTVTVIYFSTKTSAADKTVPQYEDGIMVEYIVATDSEML